MKHIFSIKIFLIFGFLVVFFDIIVGQDIIEIKPHNFHSETSKGYRDSLMYRLFIDITSPDIILITTPAKEKGITLEYCIENTAIIYAVEECKIDTSELQFDTNDRLVFPYYSECLNNKIYTYKTDLDKVESIEKLVLPYYIDSIKNDLKDESQKTFIELYKKYGIELVHALLRQHAILYFHDVSGYPYLVKFRK